MRPNGNGRKGAVSEAEPTKSPVSERSDTGEWKRFQPGVDQSRYGAIMAWNEVRARFRRLFTVPRLVLVTSAISS